MITDIHRLEKAGDLPSEWDQLASSYFQKAGFLSYLEKYNPCKQRYYLARDNGNMVSGAVVYTLRLDILTYLGVRSPMRINITGVPCSVSCAGITGEPTKIRQHIDLISAREKGILLHLNLKESCINRKYATGHTLPTVIIRNRFENWNEYLSALRSDYRRRLRKISEQGRECSLTRMDFRDFTDGMYEQYLEVYKRSRGKLEKLGHDFFRNLGEPFVLTACMNRDTILGWTISLHDDADFYFFLGGIDYRLNRRYSTYFRLLADIVRQGIESEAGRIDLGQTAEIPKMRLGGRLEQRYMEASHSFSLIQKLFKLFENQLEYKRFLPASHALKEEI